jgi:hypothetical protein
MSASISTTHATPETAPRDSLFNRDELIQFESDDQDAGRRIGKILSALFVYTIIAMSVAVWWTFRTVGH